MKDRKKIIAYGILLAITIVAVIVLKRSIQTSGQGQIIATVSSTTDDGTDMSWLYGTATSTIPGMADSDSYVLLQSDSAIPTYKDFLNDLHGTCPFYVPSGVGYRDCLANLLSDKEKVVDQMYSDLVRDIQIVSAEALFEDPVGGNYTVEANSQFLEHLATLEGAWKPYRDALCDTELSDTFEGSNEEGYIDTCKLYETTVYETRLMGFRYDWVDSFLQQNMNQDVASTTPAFKALIGREEAILNLKS